MHDATPLTDRQENQRTFWSQIAANLRSCSAKPSSLNSVWREPRQRPWMLGVACARRDGGRTRAASGTGLAWLEEAMRAWPGRGKASGLGVAWMRGKGAALFDVRGGTVTSLVVYIDRERGLADLGLRE
jgi:hypothetical protein